MDVLHHCRLREIPQAELGPNVAINANFIRRTLFRLRCWLILWEGNLQHKEHFKSIAAINKEKRRHMSILDSGIFTIHPFSKLNYILDWIFLIILYFSSIILMITWYLEFRYDITNDKKYFDMQIFINLCAEGIFIIDFIRIHLIGIIIKDTNRVLLNYKEIQKHLFCTKKYYIFLFCAIPFQSIFTLIKYQLNASNIEIKVIITLFMFLKLVWLYSLDIKIKNILKAFNSTILVEFICRTFVHGSMYLHITACIFMIQPFINDKVNQPNPGSWLTNYDMDTNYGNSIFIAQLKLQLSQVIKLVDMNRYMTYKRYPPQLQTRLLSFFKMRYDRSWLQETVICDIPETLRRDIGFLMIYDTIKKVNVFKDLQINIIKDIIFELKQEFFFTGEVIYQSGDPANNLYLMRSGCVAVMLRNGVEFNHYKDYEFFGLIGLLSANRRQDCTAIAIEPTECFSLNFNAFRRVIMPFAHLTRRFEEIAFSRIQEIVISLRQQKRN